jgi:hypothetical protein
VLVVQAVQDLTQGHQRQETLGEHQLLAAFLCLVAVVVVQVIISRILTLV